MSEFLSELREELLDGLERYEHAPRWRRFPAARGHRRFAPAARRVAAAAAAAAAAIAVAVQVTDRAPEPQQRPTPPVSRLEGFHATALVAADGSLWVTQYDTAQLLRIDPRTRKIRARIDLGGSPGGVIAANGAVWVHDWERGRLLKVDARTNRIVRTVTVGLNNSDVAFAAGAVWSIDKDGQLIRIDPETTAITRRVSPSARARPSSDAPNGATLTAAGDTLWLVAGDGRITEVDARTGDILGHARGPALPIEKSRRAAADEDALWISSPTHPELLRIDARTRRLTHFPVPGDPGAIAIVDGRIWLGTQHDTGTPARVTVLERDGRPADTTPVPSLAVNITPSPAGGAWVSFGEDSTVSPAAVRLPNP